MRICYILMSFYKSKRGGLQLQTVLKMRICYIMMPFYKPSEVDYIKYHCLFFCLHANYDIGLLLCMIINIMCIRIITKLQYSSHTSSIWSNHSNLNNYHLCCLQNTTAKNIYLMGNQ
jgi:hypothetical protein